MDDEVSDFLIVMAAKWYRDLGNSLTKEMRVFGGWWAFQNPKTLKPEAVSSAGFLNQFSAMSDLMKDMPRSEKLKIGRYALQQAR